MGGTQWRFELDKISMMMIGFKMATFLSVGRAKLHSFGLECRTTWMMIQTDGRRWKAQEQLKRSDYQTKKQPPVFLVISLFDASLLQDSHANTKVISSVAAIERTHTKSKV